VCNIEQPSNVRQRILTARDTVWNMVRVGISMSNAWFDSYLAAVVETDWTKMHALIQAAEREIQERMRVLSLDHGGAPEERQVLARAANGLKALLNDADKWRSQQSPSAG
jgi:hypothetical protein